MYILRWSISRLQLCHWVCSCTPRHHKAFVFITILCILVIKWIQIRFCTLFPLAVQHFGTIMRTNGNQILTFDRHRHIKTFHGTALRTLGPASSVAALHTIQIMSTSFWIKKQITAQMSTNDGDFLRGYAHSIVPQVGWHLCQTKICPRLGLLQTLYKIHECLTSWSHMGAKIFKSVTRWSDLDDENDDYDVQVASGDVPIRKVEEEYVWPRTSNVAPASNVWR